MSRVPIHSAQENSDAGWEDTRARKFTLGLAATHAQRLEWLEEAILLANHAGALSRAEKGTAGEDSSD